MEELRAVESCCRRRTAAPQPREECRRRTAALACGAVRGTGYAGTGSGPTSPVLQPAQDAYLRIHLQDLWSKTLDGKGWRTALHVTATCWDVTW